MADAACLVRRIDALTGLRFFASASIVLWHSQADYLFGQGAFAPFNLSGAVALFFVLSGYVLTVNAAKYLSWKQFLVARVSRIWPTHVLGILLLAALFYPDSLVMMSQRPDARRLVLNVALLQAWSPNMATFWSYNAPSWSVSCELFFYCMFPACLFVMRARPLWASGGFLAIAAVFLAVVSLFFPGVSPLWAGYINPLINLPTFALGMATGLLHLRLAPSRLGKLRGTALQVIAVATAVWANSYVATLDVHGAPATIRIFVGSFGAVWSYALLIFVLGRYQGSVSSVLSIAPFVYLGEISYAVYVFHQPLLRWHSLNYTRFGGINIWLQYGCLCAVIVAVAALVYHVVERPMQRWARSMGRDRRVIAVG